MKKLLSMLLAVMMILSSVSIAAPMPADVVTSTVDDVQADSQEQPQQEVQLEKADLQDENEYGTLIASINFDDVKKGTVIKSMTDASALGTVNLPEGFDGVDLKVYMHGDCSV